MPQKLTPPEKKRKSLERDGRNCYGQYDKASRKLIPRRKAIVNRTFRRNTKQALAATDADADDLNERVNQLKRIDWKKHPDQPLGDHLLDRIVSKIFRRFFATPNPEGLLDIVESQLIKADASPHTVQDIMRQLHSVVRAYGSTGDALEPRSTALRIDYSLAKVVIGALDHHVA